MSYPNVNNQKEVRVVISKLTRQKEKVLNHSLEQQSIRNKQQNSVTSVPPYQPPTTEDTLELLLENVDFSATVLTSLLPVETGLEEYNPHQPSFGYIPSPASSRSYVSITSPQRQYTPTRQDTPKNQQKSPTSNMEGTPQHQSRKSTPKGKTTPLPSNIYFKPISPAPTTTGIPHTTTTAPSRRQRSPKNEGKRLPRKRKITPPSSNKTFGTIFPPPTTHTKPIKPPTTHTTRTTSMRQQPSNKKVKYQGEKLPQTTSNLPVGPSTEPNVSTHPPITSLLLMETEIEEYNPHQPSFGFIQPPASSRSFVSTTLPQRQYTPTRQDTPKIQQKSPTSNMEGTPQHQSRKSTPKGKTTPLHSNIYSKPISPAPTTTGIPQTTTTAPPRRQRSPKYQGKKLPQTTSNSPVGPSTEPNVSIHPPIKDGLILLGGGAFLRQNNLSKPPTPVTKQREIDHSYIDYEQEDESNSESTFSEEFNISKVNISKSIQIDPESYSQQMTSHLRPNIYISEATLKITEKLIQKSMDTQNFKINLRSIIRDFIKFITLAILNKIIFNYEELNKAMTKINDENKREAIKSCIIAGRLLTTSQSDDIVSIEWQEIKKWTIEMSKLINNEAIRISLRMKAADQEDYLQISKELKKKLEFKFEKKDERLLKLFKKISSISDMFLYILFGVNITKRAGDSSENYIDTIVKSIILIWNKTGVFPTNIGQPKEFKFVYWCMPLAFSTHLNGFGAAEDEMIDEDDKDCSIEEFLKEAMQNVNN
jgi:hypothetical protein